MLQTQKISSTLNLKGDVRIYEENMDGIYRERIRTNRNMTNAKKIIAITVLAAMLVLSLGTAVYATIKGFPPLMIPVDTENLPEYISESDLEGAHISAHRLQEIAKERGEAIFLEGTNGRTYEIRYNMVLSEEVVSENAVEGTEKTNAAVSTENTSQETVSEPNTVPNHTHTWTHVAAEYTTIHHEAEYKDVWVEDKAAWDETVLVKEAWDETVEVIDCIRGTFENGGCYVETGGGLVFQTVEDYTAWSHSLSIEEFMTTPTNYTIICEDTPIITTETIHHDAEYNIVHHEAEGHWEKELVKDAWDERVLVHGEYDVCTGCGETR